MDIARNNAQNLGASSNGATSYSASYTVSTGSNRVLVVFGHSDGTDPDISSITYGGVSLTKIGTSVSTNYGSRSVWQLVNPSAGTANIIASRAGGSERIRLAALYLTGAHQTTAPISNSVSNSSSNPLSVSLTVTTQDSYVIGTFSGNANLTNGTGSSSAFITVGGNATDPVYEYTGNPAATGNISMAASRSGGSAIGGIVIAFAKAPATNDLDYGGVTSASQLNGTSLSFNSPNISGDNTILFVAVYGIRANGINTPTHNGTAMALVQSVQSVETNRKLGLWALVNPTPGVNTISVSITPDSFTPHGILAHAFYYKNTAQVGFPDASAASKGNSITSITDDVTTTTDNAWVISVGGETGASGAIATGTGVTQRGSTIGDGSNDSTLAVGDSNGPISPAGTYSMTYTASSSGSLGIVMAAVAPYTSSATTNPALLLSLM